MSKKRLFYLTLLLMALLKSLIIGNENPIIKEEITVIGSLIPTEFLTIARKVTIISKEDIAKAPVNSVTDLLKYILGIDLRERGISGAQGDLSIRGANFNQILVLINGIKVYDPQTAHHNLDIPLSLSDVERIEILNGHGSSIYGENAFGGVINIVTKKSFEKNLSVNLSYGNYNTFFGDISLNSSYSRLNEKLSLSYKNSDGFEYDRDFNILNFSSNSFLNLSNAKINFFIGYNKKSFGANNFYASYPSKEWTETQFIGIDSDIYKTKIKIFYRHHYDKFVLDISRPSWYTNVHNTHSYGIESYSLFDLKSFGEFIFGGEIRADEIKSSNLGNHSYYKFSSFSEYKKDFLKKFYINLALRGDYYSNFGFELTPGLSLSYIISDKFKIRSSIGKAFRIPSFTELYYKSPANLGNPDLKPERSYSFEIGGDYYGNSFIFDITTFVRKDRNLIDWVKFKDDLPWKAMNIQKVNFYGIEASIRLKNNFNLGYTYLKSSMEKKKIFISKYVLNHPVHHITFSANFILPFKVRLGTYGFYKKRKGEDGYLVIDTMLSKKIFTIEFFLKVMNLLNTSYQEIPGISMPGRWFLLGIKL